MRHFLIAAAIAVLVTGCGTVSGTRIEASDLTTIQKGRTAKSELIQKYGPPSETSVDSAGKESASWYHSQSTTDAKTFIPIAGAFIGGATTETTTLKVFFDKRGIVQDFEYSGGTINSKLGS